VAFYSASTATQVNLLELQGLIYAKKLIVEDAAGAFAKIAVAPLERVKELTSGMGCLILTLR
jgi:solute carrier family 25 protein 16